MFERLVEQIKSVTTVLCLIGRNDLCLTMEDLVVMKKAVCVLKPFVVATEEMCADKHVGVSKVLNEAHPVCLLF